MYNAHTVTDSVANREQERNTIEEKASHQKASLVIRRNRPSGGDLVGCHQITGQEGQ